MSMLTAWRLGGRGDRGRRVIMTLQSCVYFCCLFLASFDHLPKKLAQDSSDAIIVGGTSDSTDLDSKSNAGGNDGMVMKFSFGGAHQWTVLRGGSGNEYAYSLKARRAGMFVVHVPTHLLEGVECGV